MEDRQANNRKDLGNKSNWVEQTLREIIKTAQWPLAIKNPDVAKKNMNKETETTKIKREVT